MKQLIFTIITANAIATIVCVSSVTQDTNWMKTVFVSLVVMERKTKVITVSSTGMATPKVNGTTTGSVDARPSAKSAKMVIIWIKITPAMNCLKTVMKWTKKESVFAVKKAIDSTGIKTVSNL